MTPTIRRLRAFGRQGARLQLGRSRKKRQWEIARSAQTCVGCENRWNSIDDYRRRGHIAVRASGDRKREMRLAFQNHGVSGMSRAHVHLQFHENFFFARGGATGDLMHTSDLSGSDFE